MHVISIGEVLVDWLSFEPGQTLLDAATFHRALGGNATNVAIGLTRLGTAVSLIGKIGADLHGEFVTSALQREGVALESIVIDSLHPTTQCYMTTAKDGSHHYRNWPHPNANDMLEFGDLQEPLLIGCDFIHTTALSMVVEPRCATIERALATAHDKGAIISFDACLPPAAFQRAASRVERIFEKTHLLKMNASELVLWSGLHGGAPDVNDRQALKTTARQLFERYRPFIIMITLGDKGSFLVTHNETIDCQAMKVKPLSEVGAGDGFVAAFIHMLGRLLPPRASDARSRLAALTAADIHAAGIAANVAGALVTLQQSAYAGLPDAAQLAANLKATGAQWHPSYDPPLTLKRRQAAVDSSYEDS